MHCEFSWIASKEGELTRKKRWLAVGYLSVAHRARTPRLTEEQIIGILKENEAGKKVRELVRRYGVCEQTIYRWKSKYGGMDLSEARRLKALDKERRLLCVIHQRLHLGDARTVPYKAPGSLCTPAKVQVRYQFSGLGAP